MPIEPVLKFFESAGPLSILALILGAGILTIMLVFRFLNKREDTIKEQVVAANDQAEHARGITQQLLGVYADLSNTLKKTGDTMEKVGNGLTTIRTDQVSFYERTDALHQEQGKKLDTIIETIDALPVKVADTTTASIKDIASQLEIALKEVVEKLNLLCDVLDAKKEETPPVEESA